MSAKHTFAVYETIVGSSTQKLILLKLADNANDDGISWPGMDYLAKHCELSKSAVLRNLKALEEKGLIKVKRRKSPDGKTNLSNVYQLTLGSSSQLPPSSSEPLPPSSSEPPEPNNNKPNNEPNMSDKPDHCAEIFEFWKKIMKKTGRVVFSDERKRAVKKMLKAYSVEEIKQAITNVSKSQYHMDGGHNDLTLICRNSSKLEHYRDMIPNQVVSMQGQATHAQPPRRSFR